MTTILLIRHGKTDYVHNALAGRINSPLNEFGQQQANTIADSLKDLPITTIYSSPLLRTQQTAAPLSTLLEIPVQIHDGFNQVNFGNWEGRPFEELDKDPIWQQFQKHPDTIIPPNGESAASVRERVEEAIFTLVKESNENSLIAIFTHGSIIRHGVSTCIGLPLVHFNQLTVAPASVSTIRIKNGTGRLLYLNIEHPIKFI